MELQKAEGIQERCNIISFATLAEINHFHKIRVRDFKSQMQHFLQQQILFFQKVTQKLEEALHKYDSVWFVDFAQHKRDPGSRANAAEELLPVVDGGTRMGLCSPGTRV